jgi:hypothetical protein
MKQVDAKPAASSARRVATYFGLTPVEFISAAILSALLLGLNILNVLHYRFDADEPAHLHVVWSWTQGLVQYRDLFDNHMPLFHIMLSPIAALIGERATILYWMRFLLLPAHVASAWATYKIGALLFSRRIGIWSFILAGFYPGYHFIALEFRPDNLWALLSLLSLIVLLGGAINPRRALVAGLCLGLCFGITMKSTVSLISVFLSAAVVLFIGREKLNLATMRAVRSSAIAFLFATMLVPAIIAVFFSAKGVGHAFWQCVFSHQFFGHLFRPKQLIFAALLVVMFPFVIHVARRLLNAASDVQLGFRRAFIALVICFYLLTLRTFWPLIARGDYLPLYPLAFVFLTAAMFELNQYFQRFETRLGRIPVPVFVAIAEVAVLVGMQPLWKNNTASQTNLLRDILTLTTPRDYVFDCKGETVFRQRCFRPVLETITRKRIRRGLMLDDAPQRCVETRTCVIATGMKERFSPATREFLERNYLPVTEDLRVAGIRLGANGTEKRCDFDVVIPADYKIVGRDVTVSGTLDGTPYSGARFLPAGRHTFESASTLDGLALLWVRAVDHHFIPLLDRLMPQR